MPAVLDVDKKNTCVLSKILSFFPSFPTSKEMISALSCFGAKHPVGKLSGEQTVTNQPEDQEGEIVSSTAKLFPSEIAARGISGVLM